MTAPTYTHEFEDLLKAESEKAEAMSILHIRSHEYFNKLSVGINIPVIILSSIVGFLSPLSLFDKQSILLGALSILIAIAKTIDSYMDYTKRTEFHRVVSLNYAKISKFIQVQLALEKECRINAKDLLDYITQDLQNLKDQEPIIPAKVIQYFNLKYEQETTAKPSITNGLTSVKINKSTLTPEAFPIDLPIIVPPSSPITESVKPSKKPVWK
jgi:hypothetical protein